jgi:hypothetical protein
MHSLQTLCSLSLSLVVKAQRSLRVLKEFKRMSVLDPDTKIRVQADSTEELEAPSGRSERAALKTEAAVSQVGEVVENVLMAEVAHFEGDARCRPGEGRGSCEGAVARSRCQREAVESGGVDV